MYRTRYGYDMQATNKAAIFQYSVNPDPNGMPWNLQYDPEGNITRCFVKVPTIKESDSVSVTRIVDESELHSKQESESWFIVKGDVCCYPNDYKVSLYEQTSNYLIICHEDIQDAIVKSLLAAGADTVLTSWLPGPYGGLRGSGGFIFNGTDALNWRVTVVGNCAKQDIERIKNQTIFVTSGYTHSLCSQDKIFYPCFLTNDIGYNTDRNADFCKFAEQSGAILLVQDMYIAMYTGKIPLVSFTNESTYGPIEMLQYLYKNPIPTSEEFYPVFLFVKPDQYGKPAVRFFWKDWSDWQVL